MNKYRDKSDFEINKAVAEIVHQGKTFTHAYSFGDTCGSSVQWIGGYAEYIHVDYCNNPTDAMPIIIENGISSLFNGDEWICSALDGEFLSINENLYRAAMEVLMMMTEAENES